MRPLPHFRLLLIFCGMKSRCTSSSMTTARLGCLAALASRLSLSGKGNSKNGRLRERHLEKKLNVEEAVEDLLKKYREKKKPER